jgi:Fe-S-cluster containining protein
MNKLQLKWDNRYHCYDVRVLQPDATAGDFEAACDQVFSQEQRGMRYGRECIGCHNCCRDRIPVTSIDVLRLREATGTTSDLPGWSESYLDLSRDGKCIDLTLKVRKDRICQFWQKENGRCRVYLQRAFACRSYICSPMSHRLKMLRSEIINQGEDELVRLTVAGAAKEYQQRSCFTGIVDYRRLPLKKACSPQLWHYLMLHD